MSDNNLQQSGSEVQRPASTLPEQPESVPLFLSCAPEDEAFCKELAKRLKSPQRQSSIFTWHHFLILPGAEIAHEIDKQLERASMILLLISPDFMNSDRCYIEMKRALERRTAQEAWVIPILLRPVDLKDSPLDGMQKLPMNKKPIDKWPNEDEAWIDVVAGIHRTIEEQPLHPTSTARTLLPKNEDIPKQKKTRPVLSSRHPDYPHLEPQLKKGVSWLLLGILLGVLAAGYVGGFYTKYLQDRPIEPQRTLQDYCQLVISNPEDAYPYLVPSGFVSSSGDKPAPTKNVYENAISNEANPNGGLQSCHAVADIDKATQHNLHTFAIGAINYTFMNGKVITHQYILYQRGANDSWKINPPYWDDRGKVKPTY